MSEPGEFWLADVQFTNAQDSKRRAVLVPWRDRSDAIVAVVTTSAPRSEADVILADWAKAGLNYPSVVRLMRLDSFDDSLMTKRIGRVTRKDAKRLNATWAKHLKLRL